MRDLPHGSPPRLIVALALAWTRSAIGLCESPCNLTSCVELSCAGCECATLSPPSPPHRPLGDGFHEAGEDPDNNPDEASLSSSRLVLAVLTSCAVFLPLAAALLGCMWLAKLDRAECARLERAAIIGFMFPVPNAGGGERQGESTSVSVAQTIDEPSEVETETPSSTT